MLYFGAQMTKPEEVGCELLRSVAVGIIKMDGRTAPDQRPGAFPRSRGASCCRRLASGPWQHMDDTSTRLNGQNGCSRIVIHCPCGLLYDELPRTA